MDIIKDIRVKYEVDKAAPPALSEELENGLKLVSEELYSTDTHFIMEFVQNAEDNEYEMPVPTLQIDVDDQTMVLKCNEVGFNEKQVRAICGIGGSTKKGSTGYIGQKGIGFKSVFKVADVVQIASGQYTFKFDRSERLGMIAPVWDPSIQGRPGWTTFTLRLSSSQNGRTPLSISRLIAEKLDEIKPSLLLFLKKLRFLELNVRSSSGGPQKLIEIKRENLDSGFVQLIRRHNGSETRDTYFMETGTVDMSNVRDSKREGVKSHEVILAFPVDENRAPRINSQDVYAFLPMRDFGFKFIIHGDFLTSSSREDVLHDSPWNLSIRAAVVDAFVDAVKKFQERPTFQYTWIRYLPSGINGSFFNGLEHNLLNRLRRMDIIRDTDNVLRRPSDVLKCPIKFRLNGQPLIPVNSIAKKYLSDDYNTLCDKHWFDLLDVQIMTSNHFLHGLARMSSDSLVGHGIEWHEAVAYQLSLIPKSYRGFDARILDLEILPLDDGSWSRASDANRYVFQSDISNVPRHINYRCINIDVGISRDDTPNQYKLFKDLGVRQADATFVAQAILDFQGYLAPDSHLQNALFFFAYQHSSQSFPSAAGRLQLVDEHGRADIGENLYIDMPADEGKLRDALQSLSARFIDKEYLRHFSHEESDTWFRWLHDELHVNTAPRLINRKLSPEFKEMVQNATLRELLPVLKYFWPRLPHDTAAPWQNELGDTLVTLDDGTSHILSATFLKRGVLSRYDGIPFLPVDDPESETWDFLGRLGVTIDLNPACFIKLLTRYQKANMHEMSIVSDIYKQLDARWDEDAELIRNAFHSQPLVLIPSEHGRVASWCSISDIYWNGPACMTSKVALCMLYPNLADFFQGKLRVQNAPPEVLIDELKSLSRIWNKQNITSDTHRAVFDVLVGLSQLLKSRLIESEIVRKFIEEYAIFPTSHPEHGLLLLNLVDIYVPDRTGYYAECFRGHVPLLQLPDLSCRLSSIEDLLHCAGSLAQYLELCAKSSVKIGGKRNFEDALTTLYSSRYLETMSRPSNSSQSATLSKLEWITIDEVSSVSAKYSVANVAVTHDDVLIHFDEDGTSLVVLINGLVRQPGYDNQVHIDICRRLSHMLDCDFYRLLSIETLNESMLKDLFKKDGDT